MKKTKLLMPILGVAAVAGTAVPTIVACAPGEGDENEGLAVRDNMIAYGDDEGYRAILTSELPKAHLGKQYTANLKWTYLNASGQVVSNSYATSITVANTLGQSINCTYQQHATNSATVTINGENVTEGMIITVIVRQGHADASFELNTRDDAVGAYNESGDIVNNITGIKISTGIKNLDTDDNYIEFVISLNALDTAMKQRYGDDKGLLGCTDLVFYVKNSNDARTYPSYGGIGNTYLGNDEVNHYWNDQTYSLHIYFAGGLQPEDLSGQGKQVYGYLSFSTRFVTLNDGNMYAFDRRALDYTPLSK